MGKKRDQEREGEKGGGGKEEAVLTSLGKRQQMASGNRRRQKKKLQGKNKSPTIVRMESRSGEEGESQRYFCELSE